MVIDKRSSLATVILLTTSYECIPYVNDNRESGETSGQTDGRTDERTDGQTDGNSPYSIELLFSSNQPKSPSAQTHASQMLQREISGSSANLRM